MLCSLARGLTTVTHRLALCRDQAISASKCVGAPAPGTGVGVYKAGQESSDRDRTAASNRGQNADERITQNNLGRRREGRERLRHR